MHRLGGPENLKCDGEAEFANGVAATSASGIYGPFAAIVDHTNLCLGVRVEPVLEALIRPRRRTPSSHPAERHSGPRGSLTSTRWAPTSAFGSRRIPMPTTARLDLWCLALPSAGS